MILRFALTTILTLASAVLFAQAPTPDNKGWTSLFDGKNLDGWVVKCRPQDNDKRGYWKVVDGTITAETPPGSKHHYIWLLTEKEYGDFEFRAKVQTYSTTTGNSGIQVRSRYDDETGYLDGPQVDIHPPGPWRCGFVYDETRGVQIWLWPNVGKPANAKPEHAPKGWRWMHADKEDVWNEVHVVCRGTKIKTIINGVTVADYDGAGRLDDEAHRKHNVGLKGHIGLQIHPGGEMLIRFKDIEIRDVRTVTTDTRPTKIWNRTGPLGETPKHVTDTYPLSDQQNKGGWVKFEPMSDEFEGDGLDLEKWNLGIAPWKGRQPALFSDKNVTVSDGKLHLTMRKEKVPQEFEKQGYHDYTSAALHTKAKTAYGYFETKAKPMNSAGSSSFWFKREAVPGWVTEIDVFEIGGKAKEYEHKYNMNLHVFKTPQEKKHWSVGGVWEAPWRLAEDYHVYGLEWDKDEIKYFVDGVLVRSVENTHWHQPLSLIFDSETMPQWFGMPDDKDLPSTFSVEYVRAWKKPE
jgi:hypothetical protein